MGCHIEGFQDEPRGVTENIHLGTINAAKRLLLFLAVCLGQVNSACFLAHKMGVISADHTMDYLHRSMLRVKEDILKLLKSCSFLTSVFFYTFTLLMTLFDSKMTFKIKFPTKN